MEASTHKDYQRRIDSLNEKNRRLQKKVDALTYQCTMQSRILNTGNLSTLQVLLDQLTAYINSHIKKIQPEIVYTEYDARDTVALYSFREFLMSIYTQLGTFLLLPEGLIHVELKRIQDQHTEIGKELGRLIGMPREVMVEILDEQERLHEHILQILEEHLSENSS